MAQVHNGRFTAEAPDGTVVFLIGMRLNKMWKFWKWFPVFMSMGPMLSKLMRNPDLGLIGFRTYAGWRGPLLVQYWKDFEHLEHFARSGDEPHLAAWRAFNSKIGTSGDVGVWHETYVLGRYECVYSNMPTFGLAAATTHQPVARRGERAGERVIQTASVSSSSVDGPSSEMPTVP